MLIFAVVRQGRVLELLYGIYCWLRYRPSVVPVSLNEKECIQNLNPKQYIQNANQFYDRNELVKKYNKTYAINELPSNFEGCRTETMVQINSRLVLGEYGKKSARIAILSRNRCHIANPYELEKGVRHIHLVHPTENDNEIFLTTGDSKKVLDRFSIADDKLRFVVRHQAYFAGYTAATTIAGKVFFGTDFSSRPNYITTLDGEKYFFPKQVYLNWVGSLVNLDEENIVAIGFSMDEQKTPSVCIFNVKKCIFIFCM